MEFSELDVEEDQFDATSRGPRDAGGYEEVLRVLSVRGPGNKAAASLWRVELHDGGIPTLGAVEIRLELCPQETPRGRQVPLMEMPFTERWMHDKQSPRLVGDLDFEPDMDEETKTWCVGNGARAFVALPLAWKDDWLGLVVLRWREPQTFSEQHRQQYQAALQEAEWLLRQQLASGEVGKYRKFISSLPPVLDVSEGVVVVPLTKLHGPIRHEKIVDALQKKVARSRVRFAIFDLTGVCEMDTGSASFLMTLMNLAQWLGVKPLLAGWSANLAQTIVSLGIEFAGGVHCHDLEAGIAYAARKTAR